MIWIQPLFFAVVYSHNVGSEVESHPHWPLLDQGEECGLSSSNSAASFSLSSRIISGRDSELGQFPWLAPLVYVFAEKVSSQNFYCGGSLISDRYVLTAAHCKPKQGQDNVKVRFGEHDVATDPDCQDGVCTLPVQDVDVEEYVCHQDFNVSLKQNDICLVRLAAPVQFNTFVYPICLPVYETFSSIDLEDIFMDVAGWGVTHVVSKDRTNVLQTLQVPGRPLALCKQLFGNVTDKQLCAGAGGGGSCWGDSGGPLMAPLAVGGPPRYFLLGIISYGPSDCDVYAGPTVFTRVSEYMVWILDHIRE